MPQDPIRIEGYAEFRKGLQQLDHDWSATEGLKRVGDAAAGIVVAWARPRVPFKTGRAQASVKASSSSTAAKVTGGSARVPWYPWLDFGGRVGRKRSVQRAFLPNGRYIYEGYEQNRDEVQRTLETELVALLRKVGWDVDGQ